MRDLKNRIEKQDSYEVRTGLVFIWLTAFSVFGIVYSAKLGMDFVWLPCAFFALASLVNALYWFAQPRSAGAQYAADEDESEEEEYEEEDDESEECADDEIDLEDESAQVASAQLTAQEIKQRANFYAFVYHVCKHHVLGEGAWKKRGLSVPTYQRWVKILKEVRVVNTPPAGAAPVVLMSFEDALDTLAEWGKEPDYWKPVLNHYSPTNEGSTLLMMQEQTS
jgi:hypothetical protein